MTPLRFSGISLDGDEIAAPSGSLSLCAGAEPKAQALRPSVLQGTTVVSQASDRLVFVHVTTAYRHLILADHDQLYWADETTGISIDLCVISAADLTKLVVKAIGNTLIIIDDHAVHYAVWKAADSDYTYLGTSIPFVEMQFAPTSDYLDGRASFYHSSFAGNAMDDYFEISGSKFNVRSGRQAEISEHVWAAVNRISSRAADAGIFSAPFFVRYAYRLFDGSSYTLQSPPVFIPVCMPDHVRVSTSNCLWQPLGNKEITNLGPSDYFSGLPDGYIVDAEGSPVTEFPDDRLHFFYQFNFLRLTKARLDEEALARLKTLTEDWADIVKSIDIFISTPVTCLKNGAKITSFPAAAHTNTAYLGHYIKTDYAGISYGKNKRFADADLPSLSLEAYLDKAKSTAAFFRYASIPVTEDLYADTVADEGLLSFTPDNNAVADTAAQTQLPDDYKSHNVLLPDASAEHGAYTYNQRLHLYGLQERLFHGFSQSLKPYDLTTPTFEYQRIVVSIQTDQGLRHVVREVSGSFSDVSVRTTFFFYPDQRATRMTFVGDGFNAMRYVRLQACPLINGACSFGSSLATATAFSVPSDADDLVSLGSKIYTSEFANPFVFPAESINTVGAGHVIGVAAATRALSQGQVGDHDLIAFCSDGIYALKVSSTGTYSAVHNISSEVCTNPLSILQSAQSIVFSTRRSLNRLVESDVASLSASIDGPLFDVENLMPEVYDFILSLGDTSLEVLLEAPAPLDIIQSGIVIDDSVNHRLILTVACPSTAPHGSGLNAAYAYSTASQTWSTLTLPTFISVVNLKPYTYVQRVDGTVIRLDRRFDSSADYAPRQHAVIVTRTITPREDALTYLYSILQEHSVHTSDTAAFSPLIFVYGSDDTLKWHYIGRTDRRHLSRIPAHPCRFFRFAIVMSLATDEQYIQLGVEFRDKYTIR